MSACSIRRLLAVGAALLLGLPALGQNGSDKDSTDKAPAIPSTGKADPQFAQVDALMKLMLTKYPQLPGVVLAVAKDGKLVYERGFGYADRDNKQLMKPDALLRISSITKPFTAAAIM